MKYKDFSEMLLAACSSNSSTFPFIDGTALSFSMSLFKATASLWALLMKEFSVKWKKQNCWLFDCCWSFL